MGEEWAKAGDEKKRGEKFFRGFTLRLFPGRPRRTFFSAAAFLGGIFFLRSGGEDEKQRTERTRDGRGTARARTDSVSEDDGQGNGINGSARNLFDAAPKLGCRPLLLIDLINP
jgi:hypothetical protein